MTDFDNDYAYQRGHNGKYTNYVVVGIEHQWNIFIHFQFGQYSFNIGTTNQQDIMQQNDSSIITKLKYYY